MKDEKLQVSDLHAGLARSAGTWVLALAVGWCSTAWAATWRIEAEKAGDGDIEKMFAGETPKAATWQVKKAAEAGEGAFMGNSIEAPGYAIKGESHPIPTTIPHAGQYRVWVRHYQTPGTPSSFYVLFRDDTEEAAGLRTIDFQPRIQTARPIKQPAEVSKDAKPVFTWSSSDVTFERPMAATVSFGWSHGVTGGKLGIDCLVLSDDPAFDPQSADWAKLPAEPGPLQAQIPLKGMKPAPGFTLHSSFFAGVSDPAHQLKLGIVNGGNFYRDYPWFLQLGANRDHGWPNGSVTHGIQLLVEPFNSPRTPELNKAVAAPEGRFINSEGKVGSSFSFSYEPFRKAYLAQLAKEVMNFKDMEEAEMLRICGEFGGALDYSDCARARFHKWLAERYGAIAKLNELWRAQYANFDAIPLPKMPKGSENKSAWFAFREFCGLEFVTFIAEKARVVAQADPRRRPSGSQASCADIFMPNFTSVAPLDFEDLINIAFADQTEFGCDAYSTEDYFCGCDMDYLLSLMNGRRLVNNEWNVHGHDPRITARTYWTQISKGLKGIFALTMQQPADHWTSSMWALLNPDFTPRAKLGAIADTNHEAHRLERLLAPAKPSPFVKPVAFYYSRLDLSLPQPTFGSYDCAIDSPYRIYAVLRGLGYPVRWITPRQIEAGVLKDVGAVAMIGVKYVPAEAAKKLAQWVQEGGCLIGDQWPGACDEYDRPQATLAQVFGIRAEEAGPAAIKDAKLKFEETATPLFSVDPEVLRALNSEEILKSVEEMWDQWDATHPVARAAGNWHLSGYDLKKIKCVSGEIIGMAMGGGNMGRPGMVLNDYGKGHALYSAIMLGTLYEAGPLSFEWDSSREGPGLYHLLDAYLRFSGVEPFAQPGLPERMAWKLRVETPLVDAKQNVIVGMISVNDGPLAPFPLALRWPDSAPKPKLALACTGGSRRMEKAPFEIKEGKLTVTMPGFDTHATLLALTNSDPLISLEFSGAPRAIAGLLEVKPNTRLKIKATVWNPSPRKLAAGVVKLYAASGWYANASEAKIEPIDAYGSREVGFEVAPPALCAQRTLRPIVLKYESGKATSTPATEMVWWTGPKDREL